MSWTFQASSTSFAEVTSISSCFMSLQTRPQVMLRRFQSFLTREPSLALVVDVPIVHVVS